MLIVKIKLPDFQLNFGNLFYIRMKINQNAFNYE